MDLLVPHDEAKFVVADRADYDWARQILTEYDLPSRCTVLMAPVFETLRPLELAQWVLEDQLDVRVGLQLHKLIWPANTRGV
jgi:7-carboxy-7-deazaguanine synthase